MRRTVPIAAAAALATGLLVPALAAPASAAPTRAGIEPPGIVKVCSPKPGFAHCFALRNDNKPARPAATAAPAGYGPSDLQSAYQLPSSTSGTGQTIAIVDAYDLPTAESDLGTYRAQYGLPACTTANGCFRKVNQSGGTAYPRKDAGWGQEIALDLDMASATCPNCHILLVEASSASFANLGTAVNYAAAHADVVSNSYGGSDASDTNYGKYYNHQHVAVTVSSGDNGYGVEYPASSQYVTAVGGTSLTRSGSGWSETVWSGAGSGCSAYNLQPSWQGSVGTGCANRAVADVAAVADPNTGVAVYDSTPYQGRSGWLVFGGTSVAAPVIAGVYALAGNAATVAYPASLPYGNAAALHDVTGGSNGSCATTQWCTARAGWDGPTGLGTPSGTGAF